MEIRIENADVHPFYIEHGGRVALLNPRESETFVFFREFEFELRHFAADSSNSWIYLANAFVSYKQSRTELTVDGRYRFESNAKNVLLKIKSYEYVFEKNISYDTFIFSPDCGRINCMKYYVRNRELIFKKCQFLYLFGGINTFFPISLALFFISFLCTLLRVNLFENIVWAIVSGVGAIALGIRYLHLLHLLRESSEENKIREYMDSQRAEYRTEEDVIVQSYLDGDSNEGYYW